LAWNSAAIHSRYDFIEVVPAVTLQIKFVSRTPIAVTVRVSVTGTPDTVITICPKKCHKTPKSVKQA
jgi:hypothetical protein